MLRPVILNGDRDTRWDVSYTDSAVRLVDMLAARARCSVSVHSDVFG